MSVVCVKVMEGRSGVDEGLIKNHVNSKKNIHRTSVTYNSKKVEGNGA